MSRSSKLLKPSDRNSVKPYESKNEGSQNCRHPSPVSSRNALSGVLVRTILKKERRNVRNAQCEFFTQAWNKSDDCCWMYNECSRNELRLESFCGTERSGPAFRPGCRAFPPAGDLGANA